MSNFIEIESTLGQTSINVDNVIRVTKKSTGGIILVFVNGSELHVKTSYEDFLNSLNPVNNESVYNNPDAEFVC